MKIDKKKIHHTEKKSPRAFNTHKNISQLLTGNIKKTVKDYSRTETFGKLLKSLRPALNSLQPLKKSPLSTALPPLQQMLSLLDHPQMSPGNRDILLLEKFITSWLEKYGESLPGSRKRELAELANLIRSNNSQNPPYYITGPAGDMRERWKFSLMDKDRESKADEDNGHGVSCTFQVTTESLGTVSVKLSQREKGRQCLFQSSEEKVRSLLADNLDRFREQLEKHGWEVPQLIVSLNKSPASDPGGKEYKGIDLWG